MAELRIKPPDNHIQGSSLLRLTTEVSLNSLLIAVNDPKRNLVLIRRRSPPSAIRNPLIQVISRSERYRYRGLYLIFRKGDTRMVCIAGHTVRRFWIPAVLPPESQYLSKEEWYCVATGTREDIGHKAVSRTGGYRRIDGRVTDLDAW